ncbi:MAG: TetR/AcrR family transcriptional regulator [Betaproteobacteria bacterium]|nr:TetR/AcrR family transcriptional regulator [Betaproteobacteria bacterium]
MKAGQKIGKIRAKAPPKSARKPLSRERIELAALDLIEQEGLEGFSTRKLGEVLGCEAMSIYHHFPSKSHLLNALLDRVLAAQPMPAKDLAPVEWIRQLAYWYRQIGIDHPKLFQYIALHRMNTRTGLGLLNDVIGAFKNLGLGAETTARLFRSFSYYLTGAILDETSGYAKGPSAAEPVPDEEIARNFPHVVAAGPYFKQQHFERTFSKGLEIFLRAIEGGSKPAKKAKR